MYTYICTDKWFGKVYLQILSSANKDKSTTPKHAEQANITMPHSIRVYLSIGEEQFIFIDVASAEIIYVVSLSLK